MVSGGDRISLQRILGGRRTKAIEKKMVEAVMKYFCLVLLVSDPRVTVGASSLSWSSSVVVVEWVESLFDSGSSFGFGGDRNGRRWCCLLD